MEECANAIYIKNRGERIYMNERNIDIEDMQCWVFRMAQIKILKRKKGEADSI